MTNIAFEGVTTKISDVKTTTYVHMEITDVEFNDSQNDKIIFEDYNGEIEVISAIDVADMLYSELDEIARDCDVIISIPEYENIHSFSVSDYQVYSTSMKELLEKIA